MTKGRIKTQVEADRAALNGTREITEALCRLGKFSEEEIHEMVELRQSVGAKPLRLGRREKLPTAPPMGPEEIKALRSREGASQATLARHLGVATATVGQWERGQRRPDGAATKLLSLVQAKGLDYIR